MEKTVVIGERIRISLPDHHDEEDEVTRIILRSATAGVWLVETASHGRVIVFPGRGGVLDVHSD